MKKILMAAAMCLLVAGTLQARPVKGTVKCGTKKLQGVIVSDGSSFTTTDKKGKFVLDVADDADFVWVATPGGYTVPTVSGNPKFYLPADSKKFDFKLVSTGKSMDYTMLVMADPQVKTQKQFDQFAGEPLADFCKTAQEYAAKGTTVALALGDLGWDSCDLIYPQFPSAAARVGVPFYPVIGNHDHYRDFKGDHKTAEKFRETFGPTDYAFWMGRDLVIVIDNIIYDTNKKYVEGYTDTQLGWVESLLSLIPKDVHIFMAQHATTFRWFKNNSYTHNGEKMLDLFDGRELTILSGHTHINNNTRLRPNVVEWNVAGFCGSWWSTRMCNDGTPSGYKVIESRDGKIGAYYKSVGCDRDYQVQFYGLGQSVKHPNSILVNAWDWDENWTVEWFQDGVAMGAMERVLDVAPDYIRAIQTALKGEQIPPYKQPRLNNHYFVAQPSLYAKTVEAVVKNGRGGEWKWSFDMASYCDVQPHRGGAGLRPQNTVSSMKHAMDLGCNTLEMDFQVSRDGKIFVSHENYAHPGYVTKPDGTPVTKDEPRINFYQMDYEDIVKYETGLRMDSSFPEKLLMEEHKPLAEDLINFIEEYTAANGLSPMRYNIEIKTTTDTKKEGVVCPVYTEFCDKVMEFLISKNLGDRLIIQIFDVRALNYLHSKWPEVKLAYLTSAKQTDLEANLAKLDFTPDWYSPNYVLVDEEMVKTCRERGIRLVPWTVDEPADIQRMIDLGCEAVITNYPDRMLKLTRGYSETETQIRH